MARLKPCPSTNSCAVAVETPAICIVGPDFGYLMRLVFDDWVVVVLALGVSLVRKRRGRSAALLMPMRGVVWISAGRWPSSAIRMAEMGEVTSRPLEFLRVMSRA
jgi:hypothetical protein